MGVHACQRAGVKLGSKVLVCGAGEEEGGLDPGYKVVWGVCKESHRYVVRAMVIFLFVATSVRSILLCWECCHSEG